MELKRFIADNSREALMQVKQQYGEDTLIISTNKVGKKTEVICAIEEPETNRESKNPYEDKIRTESGYQTKSNTAVRKANNKKEEDYRDEISNMEFSEQLGRIVSKSESKKPSKSPDMNELMKTIQEDLSDLRHKLEKQSTAVTPITKARSALSAFSERENFIEEQSRIADSIGQLVEMHPSEQRDWNGINIFHGMPGSGKSKTISSLISGLKQQEREPVLIEFIPEKTAIGTALSSLKAIGQEHNIACYCENNISDLLKRLERFSSDSLVFVETSYRNIQLNGEIPRKIGEKDLKQFLCLAADSSASSLQNFVANSPNLFRSIIMTRMDLVPDINELLPFLAEVSASIVAVYNEASKSELSSVDLASKVPVNTELRPI